MYIPFLNIGVRKTAANIAEVLIAVVVHSTCHGLAAGAYISTKTHFTNATAIAACGCPRSAAYGRISANSRTAVSSIFIQAIFTNATAIGAW